MGEKQHNVELDFIRIFAMFAVILVHLKIYLPVPDSIRQLFTWGGYGVQIFFVLSGYLVCHSFDKKIDISAYYKKRAIRILPAYYIAVIGAMLFRQLILSDTTPDIFHLGWLRYFLGLNTILPSNNYYLWNNTYGLWTMSCFIWFYVMAPFIFKMVKSLKGAVIFFLGSFVVSLIWKILIKIAFSHVTGLESLDILTGASPFGTLYQFSIGIIVYYILKENKTFGGLSLLSVIAICGLILQRNKFIWCAICGVLIICAENIDITVPRKCRGIVTTVAKESFHVYLAHLFAFNVAWHIVETKFKAVSMYGYCLWGVISILGIILMCLVMDVTEQMVAVALTRCKRS